MRQFDFMGKRRIAFVVSIVLTIVSIAALALLHLNLGLDFTGGTVVELHYAAVPSLDDIRTLLANSGFENFQVQRICNGNPYGSILIIQGEDSSSEDRLDVDLGEEFGIWIEFCNFKKGQVCLFCQTTKDIVLLGQAEADNRLPYSFRRIFFLKNTV